jgi:hypothetical protein
MWITVTAFGKGALNYSGGHGHIEDDLQLGATGENGEDKVSHRVERDSFPEN